MGKQQIVVGLILLACLASTLLTFFGGKEAGPKKSELLQSVPSFYDRILVVRLNGMIVNKETSALLSRLGTALKAKRQLHSALKDKHVKAVIISINSPGGTVATSQELHDLILALRQKGKPVVALAGDVAASGGYYVACAADKIVAEPGTITGSIGVLMNLVNLKGIEQKLGIEPEVIKSGQFKDLGSPNRALTEKEKMILQNIIQDTYNQFVSAVSVGRKMDYKKVCQLADGRIYSGAQALKLGLIDRLGGFDQAALLTQELVHQRYHNRYDLPIDENRSKDLFEEILESVASPISGLTLFHEISSYTNGSSCLFKQPLWLWQ